MADPSDYFYRVVGGGLLLAQASESLVRAGQDASNRGIALGSQRGHHCGDRPNRRTADLPRIGQSDSGTVLARHGIRVDGDRGQKRDHDKRIGGGTMSQSGVKCPCCGAIMKMPNAPIE